MEQVKGHIKTFWMDSGLVMFAAEDGREWYENRSKIVNKKWALGWTGIIIVGDDGKIVQFIPDDNFVPSW